MSGPHGAPGFGCPGLGVVSLGGLGCLRLFGALELAGLPVGSPELGLLPRPTRPRIVVKSREGRLPYLHVREGAPLAGSSSADVWGAPDQLSTWGPLSSSSWAPWSSLVGVTGGAPHGRCLVLVGALLCGGVVGPPGTLPCRPVEAVICSSAGRVFRVKSTFGVCSMGNDRWRYDSGKGGRRGFWWSCMCVVGGFVVWALVVLGGFWGWWRRLWVSRR